MTNDRRNRTATLTLPLGPDRERTVRAARLWFQVCPEALHGRFGAAVRAGDTDTTGPVVASVDVAIWDEYGPEQAERVFELLAPVLPEGKPQMTHWVAGGPDYTSPNVVAERDPREILG